jgi:hypothetical protein
MLRTNSRLSGGLAILLAHAAAVAQPAPGLDTPPISEPPATAPTVPAETTEAPAAPATSAASPASTPTDPAANPATNDMDANDTRKTEATAAEAYVIPDAPAFTILNVTPATIDRPATLTKLGAALANVLTDKGVVRSGVALEVSLRALGVADESTFYKYSSDPLTRFVARTAFSLATVSDSATAMTPAQTRLGFGVRLVVIDDSDPLLDPAYEADAEHAEKECQEKAGGDPDKEMRCQADTYSKMKPKPKARWNYGGLSLGAAQSLVFQEARIKDGKADLFGGWVAVGFGLSTWVQQSFGAKYVRNFLSDAHTVTLSGRTRVGTERFRASVEVSGNINDPSDQDLPLAQATLGTELKLSDSLWLTANLGAAINDASDVASLFALSNVKWNFETKPSWGQGAN